MQRGEAATLGRGGVSVVAAVMLAACFRGLEEGDGCLAEAGEGCLCGADAACPPERRCESGRCVLPSASEPDGGEQEDASAEVPLATEVTTGEASESGDANGPIATVEVRFDPQGGLLDGPAVRAVTVGAPYGLLPATTREGYALAGWWSAPDRAGSEVRANTVVAVASDHVVFAGWEALTATVSFDSAGGSGCDPRVVTFGDRYGASGPLCAPARYGHTFEGWWTKAEAGGDRVEATTPVTRTGDHTLFARWDPARVLVTFDPRGGRATLPEATTVIFGRPYGPLPETSRAGHAFEGWWVEGTEATLVAPETAVATADDHVAHARWRLVDPPGFVRVPAGETVVGSPVSEAGRTGREQQAEVRLTRAWWIGDVEVSQGDWKRLSGGENPSSFPGCGDSCPVESVTWWSAIAYANARSEAEGLPVCHDLAGLSCSGRWQSGGLDCGDAMPRLTVDSLQGCTGYRLPTEVEWEVAARAGTRTATYGGDLLSAGSGSACVMLGGVDRFPSGTPLADLAWYGCNSGGATRPGRQLAPNAYGLHEVLGNVNEWTWDRFVELGAPGGIDPAQAVAGSGRTIRGGSWWRNDAWGLRAAFRHGWPASARHSFIGFRLARTLP